MNEQVKDKSIFTWHFLKDAFFKDYFRYVKAVYDNGHDQFLVHSKGAVDPYRELLPWKRGNPDSALIRAIGTHVVYGGLLVYSLIFVLFIFRFDVSVISLFLQMHNARLL